jgi:hypothetical protein
MEIHIVRVTRACKEGRKVPLTLTPAWLVESILILGDVAAIGLNEKLREKAYLKANLHQNIVMLPGY